MEKKLKRHFVEGMKVVTTTADEVYLGKGTEIVDRKLIEILNFIYTFDKDINMMIDCTISEYAELSEIDWLVVRGKLIECIEKLARYAERDFGLTNPCQWSPDMECAGLSGSTDPDACEFCDEDCDRAIAFKRRVTG